MSSKRELLAQYDLLNHWFNNSLADLSDEETNKRVHQKMNHVKYIAGHLVNAQYGIADLSGAKIEHRWNDLFAGLSKTHAQDNFPYPSIEEIKAEWNKNYPVVREKLNSLSDSALDEILPGEPMKQTGMFNGSRGDLWAFLNEHQMYHIGQIGILRRGLGKEPMKLF